MTKFIFVTGGVVSSLGKGLTSASIGMLPERRISIAVAATLGPNANPDRNGSEALVFAISRHMAPDSPVPLSNAAQ